MGGHKHKRSKMLLKVVEFKQKYWKSHIKKFPWLLMSEITNTVDFFKVRGHM
jgi:hypothetical protein